jgi:AcrR family transcriptional regulator
MVGTPNRNRQSERREATRREILDAAWDIARESSVAAVTLREIADRVGMRPPSLYSHFESKNAVFDAMFEQAWSQYRDASAVTYAELPTQPRRILQVIARNFFDFAVADLARYQLMNLRVVPDFAPSEQAYAPAVEALDRLALELSKLGLPGQAERDLCVAMVGGMVDAQQANDPGGHRWSDLLDRAVDMFADDAGLPGPRLTPRTRAKTEPSPIPSKPKQGASRERPASVVDTLSTVGSPRSR